MNSSGGFALPADIVFNREPINDAASYAEQVGASSWLYLNGPEFAESPGGMSFDDVRAAVPDAVNVISDPPRELDLELARQHVDALDQLPRPTLVSCRAGPRASAVVYMYAGLRAGADPNDVLAAVERDNAPCAAFEPYKTWIAEAIHALSTSSAAPDDA